MPYDLTPMKLSFEEQQALRHIDLPRPRQTRDQGAITALKMRHDPFAAAYNALTSRLKAACAALSR